MPRDDPVTRRTFVKSGAAVTATGVAGCSGLTGGGGPDTLTMGTIPVFPMMQEFVIRQNGWYEEALDAEIELKSFGGGPPLVQAYASGELDFAYVGISPGLVAIANGVASKVVAANVLEPNVMVGSPEWRSYWNEHGRDAFAKWRADNGQPVNFATLPAGSTPDIFLRFFISETLGLDLETAVTISGQSPSSLQSTLSTGTADAGSVIEPIPTQLVEGDSEMEPFLYAEPIMPGQPGATLQPSQALIDENPDVVRSLVETHLRATAFINDDREAAAELASEAIGTDVLPPAIAKRAINSPASTFISDPSRIVEKSLVYNDFQQRIGAVDVDLDESDVFDHSFYQELSDGGQN